MTHSLLLADNDEESRTTWARLLSNAGYHVRTAGSPDEARAILGTTAVDVAVLDLRLVDDDAENDYSGLLLAKDPAYTRVPKIILTAFPTDSQHLREVLGAALDDLPTVVAFVDKAEGFKVLLDVIRNTLEVWPRLRRSTIKVSDQINTDHAETRQQARTDYWTAHILSIAGGIIILGGVVLAYANQLAVGLVGTAGGIVAEIMGYLFYSRVNRANQRMDTYHRELLQTYWVEFLLAACEELPHEKRVASIETILAKAGNSWLTLQSGPVSPQVTGHTP
jgi:CheY-like chemotaxis protein